MDYPQTSSASQICGGCLGAREQFAWHESRVSALCRVAFASRPVARDRGEVSPPPSQHLPPVGHSTIVGWDKWVESPRTFHPGGLDPAATAREESCPDSSTCCIPILLHLEEKNKAESSSPPAFGKFAAPSAPGKNSTIVGSPLIS